MNDGKVLKKTVRWSVWDVKRCGEELWVFEKVCRPCSLSGRCHTLMVLHTSELIRCGREELCSKLKYQSCANDPCKVKARVLMLAKVLRGWCEKCECHSCVVHCRGYPTCGRQPLYMYVWIYHKVRNSNAVSCLNNCVLHLTSSQGKYLCYLHKLFFLVKKWLAF